MSAEPLLGFINFGWHEPLRFDWRAIDWVIVGGESGPGARPCNIAWIESVVGQCRRADRGCSHACFVKQLGAKPFKELTKGGYVATEDSNGMLRREYQFAREPIILRDKKGGDPAEWREMLRVREFPQEASRG